MARQTYEAWLPEDRTSEIIGRITATSVIEARARRLPMNTDTKSFPRSGGMTVDVVPKGSAYGEDVSPNDEVVMATRKFGRVVRIAEEDIDDNVIDLLAAKKLDWATAYAKHIDNSALGTSAAVGAGVPFTSVYRSVTTADSFSGYTANANRLTTPTVTYANLSDFMELAEGSEYMEDDSLLLIAHPAFKAVLRDLVDTQGRPLFLENIRDAQGATLFGHPLVFTRGAVVTATATSSPPAQTGSTGTPAAAGTAGNRLLIAANPNHLMLGVRSGPESVVIPGRDGVSALTDETLLKIRARRAFMPAFPGGFVVLEKTAV